MNTQTDLSFAANRLTSAAAAESVKPHLQFLEKTVLAVVARMATDGKTGATCDEIEERTDLTHQCASARCRQLVKRGLLCDSGVTRKTRSG